MTDRAVGQQTYVLHENEEYEHGGDGADEDVDWRLGRQLAAARRSANETKIKNTTSVEKTS